MEPDRLAAELDELLRAARIGGEALSHEAGLARDTVGRWMRTRTRPTLASLAAVEQVLSRRLGRRVDLAPAVQERGGRKPTTAASQYSEIDAGDVLADYLEVLTAACDQPPSFLYPHSDRTRLHVDRTLSFDWLRKDAPWASTLRVGDVTAAFRLLDAFNVPRDGRLRVVVAADAGQGKSWWLEHVAATVASQRERDTREPLPLLVRAPDLLLRRPGDVGARAAVIESALRGLGLSSIDGIRTAIEHEWTSRKVLVLLDGADEVDTRLRNDFTTTLRELDRSGHYVLLTTRPWFAPELIRPGTVRAELAPLGLTEREELIARLGFPGDTADRLFTGDLERETPSPLHLALAWQTLQLRGELSGRNLPVALLRTYLSRPWKDDRTDDRGVVAAKMRVLGRLAAAGAHPSWSRVIDYEEYFGSIAADPDRIAAEGRDPRSLGEQFLERLDAVVGFTSGGNDGILRFSHRPFQEGLVAHWLLKLDSSARRRIIADHQCDESWVEALTYVLVDLAPAEFADLVHLEPTPGRALLRAAAKAAAVAPAVMNACRDDLVELASTLTFSSSTTDREIAALLRLVLRDESLEWEYLVADARRDPSPRPLAQILGVEGLLSRMDNDPRARSLIIESLQKWDGELGRGEDHTPEAIREGLKLQIHRRLMQNAAKELLSWHEKFTGHDRWAASRETTASEIDGRLAILRSDGTSPDTVISCALATLDLLIARNVDTAILAETLEQVATDNHAVRNRLLEDGTSFWRHLPLLVRSRGADHLLLLALLCGRQEVGKEITLDDEVFGQISRMLGKEPNFPTPSRRLEGIAGIPWASVSPRRRRPARDDLYSIDLTDEPFAEILADLTPVVLPESTQDIVDSLDFDDPPPAADLLKRLAAATDRQYGWGAPKYPHTMSAFLAKHVDALLNEANGDHHGLLLDIFHAAPTEWDTVEPMLLLGRKTATAAAERRARLVGDWPLGTDQRWAGDDMPHVPHNPDS